MKNHHTILYIPGLGDLNLKGRQQLLKLWRYRTVSIEICSMRWTQDEAWETKLARLLDRIKVLNAAGEKVSLVGESAGAAAVTQALARQPNSIHAVVILCGKSQYPDRVAAARYRTNPALRDALVESVQAIKGLSREEKQKVLNLHPLFDPVVPVSETKIAGIKNSTMPMIGHAVSIVFANTIWSWWIVRFIKSGN